jgi:hypothetical protein
VAPKQASPIPRPTIHMQTIEKRRKYCAMVL